jgi:hypothetical protein
MISFHLGLKRLSERPSSRRAADNCEEIALPHRLLLKQRGLILPCCGLRASRQIPTAHVRCGSILLKKVFRGGRTYFFRGTGAVVRK